MGRGAGPRFLHGALQAQPSFANVEFFADRIEPVLVRKGWHTAQCHSPAMFHEYRLRGGTGGAFSVFATIRNYTQSILQLSLESEDVTASRIVRKNLFRPNNAGLPPLTATDNGGTSLTSACGDGGTGGMMGGGVDAAMPPPPKDGGASPKDAGGREAGKDSEAGAGMAEAGSGGTTDAQAPVADGGTGIAGQPLGIAHRGGSLFEDFCLSEPSGALCDAAGYDYVNGDLDTIPAFCMVREWHRRERPRAPWRRSAPSRT